MYQVTIPTILHAGSILSQNLYIPSEAFLIEQKIKLGWFRSASVVSSTQFEIAKIVSGGGKYCGFDLFQTLSKTKNTSEIGISYKEGVLKLLSQDLSLGDIEQQSAISVAMGKQLIQSSSYSNALDYIEDIVTSSGEGKEHEKNFQSLMMRQVQQMRTKLSALGLQEERVLQVQESDDDGVVFFPEDTSHGPLSHKFKFELPQFFGPLAPSYTT